MTRDRDPAGRPRNARPRDALGRPLDRDGGSESGSGSESDSGSGSGSGSAAERIPDDLVIGGTDAATLADQLLRDGRPFHAHEVLEAAWKTGPAQERDLWQGLAQIAVGLTHARRGNARGAATLLRRGAARVRAHLEKDGAGPNPYGLDLPGVLAVADTLTSRIEQEGLEGISVADLSPRLLVSGRAD